MGVFQLLKSPIINQTTSDREVLAKLSEAMADKQSKTASYEKLGEHCSTALSHSELVGTKLDRLIEQLLLVQVHSRV